MIQGVDGSGKTTEQKDHRHQEEPHLRAPKTTIKKWMDAFSSFPTISYVKIGNHHPIETTIYKWLFFRRKKPLYGFALSVCVCVLSFCCAKKISLSSKGFFGFCQQQIIWTGKITCLVIQSDLFGMVKWPFSGVKWPPTGESKGHLEEAGDFIFVTKKLCFFLPFCPSYLQWITQFHLLSQSPKISDRTWMIVSCWREIHPVALVNMEYTLW